MKVLKVLVIDDDADARLLARFALEQLGGHRVVTSAGGPGVVDEVARERPDAVLLDLGLPEPRGDRLLEALAADPRTEAVPVLFVTGEDDPRVGRRLRAAGARDVVVKPFDLESLAARVQRAVDAAAGGGAPTPKCYDPPGMSTPASPPSTPSATADRSPSRGDDPGHRR